MFLPSKARKPAGKKPPLPKLKTPFQQTDIVCTPKTQPGTWSHTHPGTILSLALTILPRFVPRSERIMPMCNSNYMEPRICSSWVEVLSSLPYVSTPSLVLPRAATALAASILSPPSKSNTNCSQAYHVAIHALRESFCVNRRNINIEQIPAIKCLTLVEVSIIADEVENAMSTIHRESSTRYSCIP